MSAASIHHIPVIVDTLRYHEVPGTSDAQLLVLLDEHGGSVTLRLQGKAADSLSKILARGATKAPE
jgi:hypothetical protein